MSKEILNCTPIPIKGKPINGIADANTAAIVKIFEGDSKLGKGVEKIGVIINQFDEPFYGIRKGNHRLYYDRITDEYFYRIGKGTKRYPINKELIVNQIDTKINNDNGDFTSDTLATLYHCLCKVYTVVSLRQMDEFGIYLVNPSDNAGNSLTGIVKMIHRLSYQVTPDQVQTYIESNI